MSKVYHRIWIGALGRQITASVEAHLDNGFMLVKDKATGKEYTVFRHVLGITVQNIKQKKIK